MAVGSIVARILTQYSDKGSKAATKDITKLGKSFDNFSKKSFKAFGIAAAASAAFAVKIGTDAVQAAIADQKSQALLASSLRNTVGATDSAIAGTEVYITAMQKQFSVADDELRPAMSRLAAATGSVSTAQSLLDTALNVSASSGADLATSVGAIIKATSGQFKALKTLVPGLSTATVKSKDFGKALEEVNKATSGAAATRANTLEYRLAGLKIAFGEILETLGYALLPVVERFATALSTKILPQIEYWISANKDRLAASFQVAADFALKLLTAAIAFGDWVANNMTTVKTLASIIAGMFVVGGIANFIVLLGSVTTAMAVLATTATGAAIASAFATAGASVGLALVGVATIAATMRAYNAVKGGSTPASASTYTPVTNGYLGSMPVGSAVATTNPVLSTPKNDLAEWLKKLANANNTATVATKNLLTAKQKELNLKLKELGIVTTQQQEEITQAAIIRNLQRQKMLSGSSTIALGGSGSLAYQKNPKVEVYVAGSVVTEEQVSKAVTDGQQQIARRNGGRTGGDRTRAIL